MFFVAAAIRALELKKLQKGDPVRIFVGDIRQQLYKVISQRQENMGKSVAARLLRRGFTEPQQNRFLKLRGDLCPM